MLILWNAGYEGDGGLGLESIVRATLMRAEEERWCSVVFNIISFNNSCCYLAELPPLRWNGNLEIVMKKKEGAERHTASWRYLISVRSTSPSIHWKSGRPNITTSLILSQSNALFGKKKKIAMGIGLGLFHNSLRKRVSVKRGAGVGVYLFVFRECCFRVSVMVRLGLDLGLVSNPNPYPKTAFFKKR